MISWCHKFKSSKAEHDKKRAKKKKKTFFKGIMTVYRWAYLPSSPFSLSDHFEDNSFPAQNFLFYSHILASDFCSSLAFFQFNQQ